MCISKLQAPPVDARMQVQRDNIKQQSTALASRIAACAFVAACGATGISHAQSGILPIPIPIPVEREWYYEHEFALTPGLRAEPRHAILLKLEHGDSKDKTVVNSIPYRVPEDRTFDLCVPKDDPYIRSMTLMSEDGRNVVVQVPRGAPCKTRTISAGVYRLQIEHDGKSVPAEGGIAFVHVPRTKRLAAQTGATLQAGATLQSSATLPVVDSTPCQGLSADTAQSRPRHAFRTADGRWLYSGSDVPGTAQVNPPPALHTAATVDLGTAGWTTCRNFNGYYEFAIHKPSGDFNVGYLETTNRIVNGVNVAPLDITTLTTSSSSFELVDLGNFQLTMDFYQSGTRWPVFVGTDNLLHWSNVVNGSPQPAGQATPLTNAITYYPPGTPVPDLLEGEAALTTGCNYDTTNGTWVIRGNMPDLGAVSYSNPFTGQHLTLPRYGGLGHPGDSVRLGPRTVFQMFSGTFYAAAITYIGESQSCVWFQDQTLSFKVVPAEQWIASTNECGTCNLSGIDLSGLDLSQSYFNYSTFNGANLTNTLFRYSLAEAVDFSGSNTRLAGTDFTNALIASSRFRNTDVSTANMRSDQPFAVGLDFYAATLSVNTMHPSDWRYSNDFNSATFKDSNGATVSSIASPLNLTNANMHYVHMAGITLTGANVSGADFTGADLSLVGLESVFASTPAIFNQARMTKASLKNANLQNSFFRCASMSPTNLGGADLSGAWLEEDASVSACGPTSLASSYMQNTRLTGAHMTHAVLDYVSWYNASASGTATGDGAFLSSASFILADLPYLRLNGATLQNATLTNTVFIGADLTNVHASGANGGIANLRGTIFNNTDFSSANLANAGVSTTQDAQIYLEVLVDPDRYQKPPQYQYLAVNRPPTNGTPNTANAVCPNGVKGDPQSGCGTITSSNANWIPISPPQEPTDCQPSQYDSQGNVIAVTCSSSRHPAQ